MKKQQLRRPWPRLTRLWLLIALGCILSSCVVQDALGATYFKFTYPSTDGVGGRFVVTNEANGDSIAGGVLTETERAALTYWKGSTSLDPGSYTVEGFIFESSDTSTGAYRVDVSAMAAYDSILIVLDSLEALEAWAAHQTTSDSLYDSLLIILDSLEALEAWVAHQTTVDTLFDSAGSYDDWMAHQTTVDSLWDSLLALQDTTEAALSDVAVGDKVWVDASSRTLSAYRWTVVEKDSALAALTDAAIGDKVWTDAATRSVTESVTVDVSDAMTAGGLISKTEDSVWANRADYKATGYSTHNAADVWTSGTRALTTYIWSTAEKDSVISSLADAVLAEKFWEYDSSNVSSSGGMGLMLKDTTSYQGSASGLTASEVADSVWNRDTSDHSTAASYGVIIKDTGAYQGGAAGLTASDVADSVWNRDTSDQSTAASYGVILKDTNAYQGGASGLTAAEVADSVWDEDTTGHYDVGTYGYEATGGGEGSDTTAIRIMMYNENFARVAVDTPILLWTPGQVKLSDTDHAAIEDSVHENAADYKATGYSSHSAADIWTITGGDSVLNAIEDANKTNFKADVSAMSTHSVLDVYNQFITGANEEAFWVPKAVIADTTWLKFNDGSNEDNFKADVSALSTFDEATDSVIVDVSAAITTNGLVSNIEDTVHALTADYKADVSTLALQVEVANLDGWSPITISESLVVAMAPLADRPLIGDTIQRAASTFDPSLTVVTPTDTNESGDTLARLKDSTIFQGAAASASSIADAVWDEDTATHNTAGSYGLLMKDTSVFQVDISTLALQTEVTNLDGWDPTTDSVLTATPSAYKADVSALALQTEVVNIDGWNPASDSVLTKTPDAYKADVTGMSTFDPTSDSVIVDVSSAITTDGLASKIEDTVHALAADYRADVSTLALQAEVVNLDGWDPLTDNDSLIIDISSLTSLSSQSTVDSIWDSLLALQDTTEAALSDAAIAEKTWEYDSSNVSGGMGQMLKDTTAYQGPTSALTLDAIADTVWAQVIRTLSPTGIDAFWDEDTTGHGTASSYSVMLKDTGAYQGAAAGITASEISDSVWKKAQSAYTTSGTFGYNLDTTISSVDASGSGAYTFNIVLIDSGAVPDSVIPEAKVYVNNYAQSATPYWDITDNNGVAALQINAGNWVRFTTEPGFAQNLDSFTNSGAATETLYVYRDAGSKTTVAFELQNPSGDPYSLAKININLVAENDSILRIGDSIVISHANYEIRATANSEGLASINLYPNSDYSNDSTYYRCIIRDQYSRLIIDRFKCRVPDTSVVMRYQNLTRWE